MPADHAAEMLAYDTAMGEFRVHYAGFFDPGFGHADAGGEGTRAVLEVRSHEVPFMLEDGQRVGHLVYERLVARPDRLYGADIGSSYQRQGLAVQALPTRLARGFPGGAGRERSPELAGSACGSPRRTLFAAAGGHGRHPATGLGEADCRARRCLDRAGAAGLLIDDHARGHDRSARLDLNRIGCMPWPSSLRH